MSIDLHDPAATTRTAVKRARKTAKRARKQARRTVDAATSVDLHVPAQTAKKVAKRAARKAAKRAGSAAGHAAVRKTKPARRRVARVTFGALAAGALVGLAIVLARRMRAVPPPAAYEPPERISGPDPGSFEPTADGDGHPAGLAAP